MKCRFIKKIIYEFKNDPVKKCPVYINEGCSHVDGILCNYPNCSILDNYYLKIYKKRVEDGAKKFYF